MNFNPANLIWICPFCAAIGWILHAFCAISGRQADHEEEESHARIRYAMQETIGERAQGYWHVTGDNPNVMLTKGGPRPEEIEAARVSASTGDCPGMNGCTRNHCPALPFTKSGQGCADGRPWGEDHGDEEEYKNRKAAWFRAWLASHGLPVEETVPSTGPGEIERR